MNRPAHGGVGESAADRAAALVAQMSLAERCHQLTGALPFVIAELEGDEVRIRQGVMENPPGHVAQLILADPAQLAAMVGTMQRAFVEQTRLGIPALFHAESLNGFLAGGHMSFPTAIGLASTWSPDLVEEMTTLIRSQMIRVGMRHSLSPVMDVALDPRWGRVHETYGEDPYLVTAFSVAFTRGMQGQDLRDGVVATGKHFLGYANPEGGLNAAAIEMGWRRLRDVFGMPFEAAIQLAGLGSIMNTYSDVDGIPAAASHELLTGLLREVMGFRGFVSADYASIEKLVSHQKVARHLGEAGRFALSAGLDVEFPLPLAYGDRLQSEVEAGRIGVEVVDASVRRVLEKKFALGLFEHPYPTERIDVDAVAVEGAQLSLELARRGVVLIENDGILPLAPGSRRIAVVGPHADRPSLQFATYTYPSWRMAVDAIHLGGDGNMVGADPLADTWAQALFVPEDPDELVRRRYGASSLAEALAPHAEIVFAAGSGISSRLGDEKLAEATAAATRSDLVVLALGGASLWFNGERTEGEASDTGDLTLPRAQIELVEAVAATGTPYVVVLFQGRPYVLPDIVLHARAIMISAYGGPYGASAVADVLIGAVCPSGRLPYSIPRHSGQLPVYHHQKNGSGFRSATPPSSQHHYLDMPATPQYPFGHGRSYSTFRLEPLTVTSTTSTTGAIEVTARVENTGTRAATAIVQLYARIAGRIITRPAQQLVGFVRVDLDAAEGRLVSFRLDVSMLGATGSSRRFEVEAGDVELLVGMSSDDLHAVGSCEITGTTVRLRAEDRAFLSSSRVTDERRPTAPRSSTPDRAHTTP